jgi:hypothetical protein
LVNVHCLQHRACLLRARGRGAKARETRIAASGRVEGSSIYRETDCEPPSACLPVAGRGGRKASKGRGAAIQKVLGELNGPHCRMRAARNDLVRERDDARREELVCHLDGEVANRDGFTPFDREEEPGPRWSTVRNGFGEIISDFADRDTGLESQA